MNSPATPSPMHSRRRNAPPPSPTRSRVSTRPAISSPTSGAMSGTGSAHSATPRDTPRSLSSRSHSASGRPRRCSRCATRCSCVRCHSLSRTACSGSIRPMTRRKAVSARCRWPTTASYARSTASSPRSPRTPPTATGSRSSSAIVRNVSSARSSARTSSPRSASAHCSAASSVPATTARAPRRRWC